MASTLLHHNGENELGKLTGRSMLSGWDRGLEGSLDVFTAPNCSRPVGARGPARALISLLQSLCSDACRPSHCWESPAACHRVSLR